MQNMVLPTKQLFRILNALVRTAAQRNHIVTQLGINNGAALDPRHDGFYMGNNKLMYNLPNGDGIPVLMS
jgi:hypothetical protein